MSQPHNSPQVTPERIWQFAFGYAPPLMIEAAIRHRVFDILDAGPACVDQIADRSGASRRGLRIVLNALVSLGLLSRDDEGLYSLTPESAAFLVSTRQPYFGGIIRHTSEQLLPNWMRLTDVVATGKPAAAVNQEKAGGDFFHEFVESIFPMSYGAAQALAGALGVAAADRAVPVLDIAAGSGVWGIALAQASPQVSVTAVDWSEVIPVTRQVAARLGVADRFRFVEGDLLAADFGTGYAVATLGHILHSEGEARSRALLRTVWAALTPGGTIAIAEMLPDEDRRGPAHALIFAVNMLVNTDAGDTFTFSEIGGWLREAGFADVRSLDAPGPSPLILATKPA